MIYTKTTWRVQNHFGPIGGQGINEQLLGLVVNAYDMTIFMTYTFFQFSGF